MTAKEMIEQLNQVIAIHGDLPLICEGVPVKEVKYNSFDANFIYVEVKAGN
jgi:hypothetical protein